MYLNNNYNLKWPDALTRALLFYLLKPSAYKDFLSMIDSYKPYTAVFCISKPFKIYFNLFKMLKIEKKGLYLSTQGTAALE